MPTTVPELTLTRQPGYRRKRVASGANQQWIHSARKTIKLWDRRLHERRALARLSDDLLRDIGITRAAADAEAKKWFWQE